MLYTSLDAYLSSFFTREIWHQLNCNYCYYYTCIINIISFITIFEVLCGPSEIYDIHAHILAQLRIYMCMIIICKNIADCWVHV